MTTPHAPSFRRFLLRAICPATVIWLGILSASLRAADVPKTPELRKPGFIFLELNTRKRDEYVAFFENVMGFKVKSRGERFVELETESAQLLLNDPDDLPAGHPFYKNFTGSGQGMGVEIGLVVADLDKSFAAAKKQGWQVSAGIGMRPWGVRDFRVLSPDGYYLRLTEAPH